MTVINPYRAGAGHFPISPSRAVSWARATALGYRSS